ncbi:MAG TPA: hypothetical protein VF832_01920, partial [Longimicrobiales bacterium]
QVPVAAAALDVMGSTDAALELALSGGEDYELCFVAAAGTVEPLAAEFATRFAVALTRVGQVTAPAAGGAVSARAADGSVHPLLRTGYRHFEGGEAGR